MCACTYTWYMCKNVVMCDKWGQSCSSHTGSRTILQRLSLHVHVVTDSISPPLHCLYILKQFQLWEVETWRWFKIFTRLLRPVECKSISPPSSLLYRLLPTPLDIDIFITILNCQVPPFALCVFILILYSFVNAGFLKLDFVQYNYSCHHCRKFLWLGPDLLYYYCIFLSVSQSHPFYVVQKLSKGLWMSIKCAI